MIILKIRIKQIEPLKRFTGFRRDCHAIRNILKQYRNL